MLFRSVGLSKHSWRSSNLLLIRIKEGGRKFTIPLPLALLEDFLDSIVWVVYWVLRVKPNLLSKIKVTASTFQWITDKPEIIMEILEMPVALLRGLRKEGPLTLVKVQDGDVLVEIKTI